MKFSKIARQQVVPYWEGSFSHPFLTELQPGRLIRPFSAIISFKMRII